MDSLRFALLDAMRGASRSAGSVLGSAGAGAALRALGSSPFAGLASHYQRRSKQYGAYLGSRAYRSNIRPAYRPNSVFVRARHQGTRSPRRSMYKRAPFRSRRFTSRRPAYRRRY